MERRIERVKERTKNWWRQNLANLITVIGLIFSFLFLHAVLFNHRSILKIMIYASIAGITDFIDGLVARALKSETIFGSYMDRIRDRIFVYPGIIILGYQHKNIIFHSEFLFCILVSLIILELMIFRIGVIGLWWHIKGKTIGGKDIDLNPSKYGKRKMFTGFIVVFIFIASLGIKHLWIPCFLDYSIFIIYVGLCLMVYWAYVSLGEYMKRGEEKPKQKRPKQRGPNKKA